MTILFSTTKPASPACQPPARIYFEAPDDALLARVTEKVAELMGRHLSYIFHDEAPGGVTPIVLEDVGPSTLPVPSAAVALSDDLRDGLVAISKAVADQDDRAAQAMLREILAVPQPSPTAQADSQPAPVLDYPPLPRVGAIGYASVVDIESYAKTLTIGPHLPGVRDIALWTTDQMRAYVDADRAARAPATPPTKAVEELIRLKAQAKQDKELILQLVETLASVDAAMPFPVARQVLKVARARLEQLNRH